VLGEQPLCGVCNGTHANIHFDPTLVKSLQIILGVGGASFVSFDSPLELRTKIVNKKIIE